MFFKSIELGVGKWSVQETLFTFFQNVRITLFKFPNCIVS